MCKWTMVRPPIIFRVGVAMLSTREKEADIFDWRSVEREENLVVPGEYV